MKVFFFLASILVLLGCGKGGGTPSLQLRLQLPSSIAKGSARYQRFSSRVDRMEIKLDSSYEKGQIFSYRPSDWESIQIPEYPFTSKDTDKLKIQISVWDRKADGTLRNFAALTGHQEISAEEVRTAKPSEIKIRLSLQVSAGEYD